MSKFPGDCVHAPGRRPGAFGWARQQADDADVISLAGELDLAAAAELRLRLMSVAESSTAAMIVLDLSDVRFIDAQCSGVIVAAWQAARRRGGQLEVGGLRGIPKLVFDVLGLEPILVRRTETRGNGRDPGDRGGRAGGVGGRSSVGGAHAAG